MSSAVRALPWLLALSLACCERVEPEPVLAAGDARPGGRIALAPLGAASPAQLARVLARLAIPEGLEPWRIEGGRGAVVGDELRLFGKGPLRLVVPGPIEVSGAERIELALAAPTSSSVVAHCTLDDGRRFDSERGDFGGAGAPRRVTLELPGAIPASRALSELVFEFEGAAAPVLAGGLEFRHVPPAARVADPDAGGADELVASRSELRRGFALAPGRALVGRIDLPEHALLRFAYAAAPHDDGRESARAQVSVRVERGGDEVRAEYALGTAGWKPVELALEALGAGPAQVRFELRSPEGDEAAALLSDARVLAPDPEAATVLLVTSDTHRADHIGAARSSVEIRTPAIDALARRGVLFEDCWSSTNVTNPSHIALMTGLHPRDVGILDNATELAEGAHTLAEHYAEAGYSCLAVMSVRHLGPPTSGLGQGFHCALYPYVEREARESVAAMLEWLEERRGEPVFAWLHVYDAHDPYAPPPEFAAQYYPAGKDPFDAKLPAPPLPDGILLHTFVGLRDLDYPPAMYRAEIASLDAELARVLDLERVRKGIVAFVGDHGESLGEHGVYYGHAELYPQTIHVPLVLAWPGAPAGSRVTQPVRQIDLGCTLLELSRIAAPDFPGRELLAAVRGEQPVSDVRYFLSANFTSAAISAGGWHLILGLRKNQPEGGLFEYEAHRVELYDLATDPECTVDLVEREPERAKALRAHLVEWLGSPRSNALTGAVDSSRELHAQLARLGYVDSERGKSALDYLAQDCDCAWCARFR